MKGVDLIHLEKVPLDPTLVAIIRTYRYHLGECSAVIFSDKWH